MKAWLFQDHRQKQKLGDKAPWSVGWIDPDGRRKSKPIGPKSRAEKFARKVERQLAAGTHETAARKKWKEFRAESMERTGAKRLRPRSRKEIEITLNHFERIVSPQLVSTLKTTDIDKYLVTRVREPGRKPESVVSAYTIKKELSAIRAALCV